MSSSSWEPQTPVVEKDRLENLTADDMNSAADLYGIRLRMEEKRKRIEAEKRQQELIANRQREKVGKAAFLQVKYSALKKKKSRSNSSYSHKVLPSCDVTH